MACLYIFYKIFRPYLAVHEYEYEYESVEFLVFFWCSSGVLLCYRTPEERQKNARRTPEEPRRTQKEKNTSPPAFWDLLSSSSVLLCSRTQKNTRRVTAASERGTQRAHDSVRGARQQRQSRAGRGRWGGRCEVAGHCGR